MYKLNICTEQTTPLLLAEKSDYTLTASKLTQALEGLCSDSHFQVNCLVDYLWAQRSWKHIIIASQHCDPAQRLAQIVAAYKTFRKLVLLAT